MLPSVRVAPYGSHHVRRSQQPLDEAIHRSLRRRLMVTEDNGLWRMRVPLMQRWLRQRG